MRFTEHSLFQWFTEAQFWLETRLPREKKKISIWSSLHWECQKNLWSQCHHWLNSWAIQRVLWLETAFLTPWEKMQREPVFGAYCKHKNFLLPFKESLIQMLSFIFFFLCMSPNGIQIIQLWFFSEMAEWLKYTFFFLCYILHLCFFFFLLQLDINKEPLE